jgi:signal transduction histidine kinase
MNARSRLRFEILAGCALIAAVLWAMVGLVLYEARSLALERAEEVGRSVARMLAEFQDSSIRAIDLSLQILRHDWMRERAGFEAAVARHEAHLKKEQVVQIAVVDADGWVLYSRMPQPGKINFADRDYFQRHKQRGTDELDVSAPVHGRITGRWAIQLTRPLFDAGNRFAGIIVVAVPPPGLERVYNQIALGDDGVITLARSDGAILARVANAAAAGTRLPKLPGLDSAGPMEGRFIIAATVDGAKRMFSFRRLESHPLTVYFGQGLDTVLASYYRQRNAVLAGSGAATLLLFAVALLFISRSEQRARFLEDRERIMLELHDGSIQSIYAIGLTLENALRLLEKDPPRAARAIADAGASLNLVIQELRAFISGEQRAPYTEAQFMAEIERMLPQSGPRFTVDVDRSLVAGLSAEEAAHLLRIAREAISNVVRHANASTAQLSLQRRGDAVCLDVSDDGIGITEQKAARSGLGLHHIQARARKLRGRASIVPMPDHGTRVAVEFPHRA